MVSAEVPPFLRISHRLLISLKKILLVEFQPEKLPW